ncbi:MAG: phosphoribosylaminoimidazolesuccinocarboxamide synthase [Ignavibacteriales bacterium]|nr:phosphoribosylaminoimidazolesuccinocarboxamide synthase [Ignavibacteriales bacterium]
MTKVLLKPEFKNLSLVASGKVREIYSTGENLLFVSSDRLSAFDVIMNQGIPYKGSVLNSISAFWFDYTKDLVPNHFITMDVDKYPSEFKEYVSELDGRSMLVKKGKIVPIECIVRGYLSGTGWNDYKSTGSISGVKLPAGLLESEKLDEPIFTPSTKAEIGDHDENISFETACEIAGKELMENIREKAIAIYKKCSEYALEKGVIIADTKMEFALDADGELMLADEVLTPDSSRFWDLASYEPGKAQMSYDKQFVRDFLLSIGFNKQPPAPDLPEEIIQKTSDKYLEAYSKLTGKTLI